jgi:hypothetical protein
MSPSLKLNHSEIVLRNVPALFSMGDISNFLSGIQVRSDVSGYFVVFHFTESEEARQELFMDVYVELESINGVEIALIRNNETFCSSGSSSKLGLSPPPHDPCPPGRYTATRRDYCVRIEAVRNDEIFCAKNVGIKITAASGALRLPAISVLNALIASSRAVGGPSLLSLVQMPPSLLIRTFPRFFTKLEARLKGDKSKTPCQWTSYFDDTSGSYTDLEHQLDFIFTNVSEQVSGLTSSKSRRGDRYDSSSRAGVSAGAVQHPSSEGEGASLADDLLVILGNLVHVWSSLLCQNGPVLQSARGSNERSRSSSSNSSSSSTSSSSCSSGGGGVKASSQLQDSSLLTSIEVVSRQIQFYHILHNFEIFHC